MEVRLLSEVQRTVTMGNFSAEGAPSAAGLPLPGFPGEGRFTTLGIASVEG